MLDNHVITININPCALFFLSGYVPLWYILILDGFFTVKVITVMLCVVWF